MCQSADLYYRSESRADHNPQQLKRHRDQSLSPMTDDKGDSYKEMER